MKPTRNYTPRLTIPLAAITAPAFRARFDAKIVPDGDCHRWTGARSTNGYGHIWLNQIKTTVKAHRVAYMLATGAGIDGRLDLDHLCRNRWCVNPDHLEPVTRAENLARGEGPNADALRSLIDEGTCLNGHDLTAPNAWRRTGTGGRSRVCRLCSNAWERQRQRKQRSVA